MQQKRSLQLCPKGDFRSSRGGPIPCRAPMAGLDPLLTSVQHFLLPHLTPARFFAPDR